MDEFDSAADYDAEAEDDSEDGDNAVAHQRGDAKRGAGVDREKASRSHHSVRLAMALTPTQRIVLEAMASGRSIPQAAKRAGVDRSTVNRWKKRDAKFIAAYNAWELETCESGHSSVLALIPLAADAVREAIELGNGWLALQVLQGLGLMKPKTPGPATPKEVRRQMRDTRRRGQVESKKQQADVVLLRQEVDRLEEQARRFREKQREKRAGYVALLSDWTAYVKAKRQAQGHEPLKEHNERIQQEDQKSRRESEQYRSDRKKWDAYFQDPQRQTPPEAQPPDADSPWKPAAPEEQAARQEPAPAVAVSENPDQPEAAAGNAINIAPHESPDEPPASIEPGSDSAACDLKTTTATATATSAPTPAAAPKAQPSQSVSKLNPDFAPPRDDRRKPTAAATESRSGVGASDATSNESPPLDEDE